MVMLVSVGNVWGATTTYQHIFSAKPSTGNNVNLSSVSWNITATQLGNYNSTNYAGVQLGTKSASGSITLTSSSAWGSVAGDYKDKTVITEVRIWMNAGTDTPSGTVTIGGVAATDDGTTVTKNSSASSYTDATCVTYTPASNGNTGVVVITVSTSSKAGYICAMEIDCEEPGSTPGPAVKSVQFTPNGGEFLGSQSVELSQEDNKAIYYTYDAEAGAGDPSTSSPWALYESALNLTATTTIYAAAKDGDDWSSVTSKTFTKIEPLTTMAEVQAEVPSSGTKQINVTITNWVVTAVSGNQVWIADATNEKGILLYKSGHGFAVGNQLNGTVLGTGLTKYNGAAELNSLTKADVSVTTAAALTPRVTTIAALTSNHPAEQGTVVKLENITYNGTAFSDGVNTIIIDTRFYNPTLESSKKYDLIGVVFYGSSNAIKLMPRLEADVKEIIPAGAPEFEPTSQKFLGSIDVTLSQSASLPIYYTDNASIKDDPSTSTWTEYTSAINVTATKTIYAAAKDGDDWSDVSSATYTKAEPLTTMAAVQAAATQTYDQLIDVTITNWVVTGIDGSQVWLTDASNEKGILLYKSNNGFAVNKKLIGTVFDTKIKIFNGYAELTSLVAGDVDVTDADEITPRTTTIAALTSGHPAEQGTIVKLENLTYNGTNFSDGTNTITIDTRFHNPTLNSGKKYDLTGVVYYGNNAVIKLMPRSEDDVKELASKELASISLGGEYPTVFETGDAFSHEGMVVTAHYNGAADETVTASATFSGYDMSVADTYEVTVSYTEGEITKTAKYNITVSDPAPTGDFEELDGELVAGDYLIYEGGSLMKAEIENSRFYYEEATPDANGIISNPSQYAVWTLAKSGAYWTIYNAKTGKYAAGTEVANKAQLLDDGTVDKSLWSISEELVVTNKANAAKNVNATLRHNVNGTTNYGFACYGASTGGKPVFYKKAAPSYSISATLTGCTADAENAKKVPQALDDDVVLKYNLTTGYIWPDVITVKSGETTLTADDDYIWDNTSAPAELLIEKEAFTGNIAITITATEKSLENITIVQAPTKVAYETGEFFNPAGLQIQLNYTAGASDVVVYNDDTKAGFTFSPNLETALATTDENVEITYAGESVNQAITVTDPVAVEKTVVIIAEYNNKLYAMSNAVASSACAAIEVTKDGDDLVVTSEDNKAAVQWFMSKLSANVKLQVANNEGKYLSAGSSAALSLVDVATSWNYAEADGKYLISKAENRAIMYQGEGNTFKHYSTNNVEGYARVSEIFEVADGATNIKVVEPIVYEFVVDPDEDVAFGTVEQGETVDDKSFEVTLTNIASATVTLSDDAAFSINKSSLDADGGTITITPKTNVADNFSATITLHDEDGNAEDKLINVTMKVVAPKDCDRTDDFNTVDANNSYLDRESDEGWNAVNTAVVVKDEVTYWMINGKTSEKGVITSPEFNYGIKQLSFDYYYSFNESNGISFKVEIKQNGSVVKTETITKADAVKNTIYSATIENINLEGKYQIVFTNLCPTGKSNGNADRYAIGNLCWKKYGEPVYETVRENLAASNYYTVCYNKTMTAIKGASLWEFEGKDAAFAYIKPATAPYPAGKPYIVYAESEKLEAVLEGDAVEASAIVANGALHGTFSPMDQDALNTAATAAGHDLYLVIDNELHRATGEGTGSNSLPANRAYVVLDEIDPAPANMPAHVRSMPLHKDTATGMDELNASETPVKVMINGQMYILRGEKMYDATGRLVK